MPALGSHLEVNKAVDKGKVHGQGKKAMGTNFVCPASPFCQLLLGSCDSSILLHFRCVLSNQIFHKHRVSTPHVPGTVWALGFGGEQGSVLYSPVGEEAST